MRKFKGIRVFKGLTIHVQGEDEKVFFNAADISKAVGYAKFSSLNYHALGMYKERDGEKFLTLRQINKIAKLANRTPLLKEFAKWAKNIQDTELAKEQAAILIQKLKPPSSDPWPYPISKPGELISITEASTILGMNTSELSNWLVSEGYASRYTSNNALKWSKWFKEHKYGARPIIKDSKGERESNVAKLTNSGLEFIKNRLSSQREDGVLAFGAALGTVNEKIEELIKNTFEAQEKINIYDAAFGSIYEITQSDLIDGIKGIVAQVKLKETK